MVVEKGAGQGGGLKRVTKMVLDGWSNLITGLGSARDKGKYTRHKMSGILPDEELESIYACEGLGARIITRKPDDMFREGWEYEFPDMKESEAEKLIDEYKGPMETIGAVVKIKEAFYWARLYGGSVILIGALDGQPLDAPLKPKRIRSFEYLKVIDRSDIEFSRIKFQMDPEKPRYGLPEFYPISFTTPFGGSEVRDVHYTRVIEIHGNKVPEGATMQLTQEQRYWGVSMLQNVYDYLKTVGGSVGSVRALLDEVSVGKYKFADLMDMLGEKDGEELVKTRIQVMDLTKSVFHSMFLDKDDDFIRDNASFAGIPEIMYIFFMLVSSCTGYPITVLFGVSPAGLNATGESDMRNYYDEVRAVQKSEAEPILLRLVKIISEWKGIEEPYIKWNPLRQLSDKEQAEVDKLNADTEQVKANTYKTYIDMGALEPYEARFLQFGDTLDDIPVPEDLLPPVESVPEGVPPEGAPGEKENPEGDPDDQKGEPVNEDEPPDGEAGEEGDEPAAEEGEESEEEDPDAPATDEEIAARIAELKKKDKLTEEEQAELDELEKKVKEGEK